MRYLRQGLSGQLLLVLAFLALGGCAQYNNNRGVEVTWDAATVSSFTRGTTTRADVLRALGPPSQIIASGDETVLYYLQEQGKGEGLLLIVYNRFELDTRYDRAVFFFDASDRLTDYSTWIRPSQDDVAN